MTTEGCGRWHTYTLSGACGFGAHPSTVGVPALVGVGSGTLFAGALLVGDGIATAGVGALIAGDSPAAAGDGDASPPAVQLHAH